MDDTFAEADRLLSLPIDSRPGLLSRRRFLQASLATAGAGALTTMVPPAWRDAAFGASPIGPSDGVLVMVQLGGGNDGLNTVIPIGDGAYYAARRRIAIPASTALPIGSGMALHPNLTRLKQRYDAGHVAVVQGVGYANPDLSHFNSIATWMRGTANPGALTTGWLGRYLDGLAPDNLLGVSVGSSLPLQLVGARTSATALPLDFGNAFGADRSDANNRRMFDAVKAFAGAPTGLGAWGDAVAQVGSDTMDLATTVSTVYRPAIASGSNLVRSLTLAARLVNANLGIRVLTVASGDFDTHDSEPTRHGALMADLDLAISSFFTTLGAGWANRCTLVTFSEFGRRLADNNSSGCDHGAASNLFVVGDKVKGGMYGAQPSLTAPDDHGNLVANVDFRSVYASILGPWMAADASGILGASYPDLGLFNSGPSV